MKTTELIRIIDSALVTLATLPEGFNTCWPNALKHIDPAQLLELADHYGKEPRMGYGNSNEVCLDIGPIGCQVEASAIVTTVARKAARELLAEQVEKQGLTNT